MFEINNDVTLEREGKKVQCRLVGWKLRENRGWLLVEPPLVYGDFPPLRIGHTVTIRLESGGRRFDIASVFVEPLKKTDLLMFTILEEMEIRPLRSEERIRCAIPVKMGRAARENGNGPSLGKGIIFDLCKGGAGIYTKHQVDLPEQCGIYISFSPGGIGPVTDLKLKVLRIKTLGPVFEYCGKFETGKDKDEDRESEIIISSYVELCEKWGQGD